MTPTPPAGLVLGIGTYLVECERFRCALTRRPRIAVSVLLENGPGWRRKANEVGRDLLRAYFADRGSRGVTVPDGL